MDSRSRRGAVAVILAIALGTHVSSIVAAEAAPAAPAETSAVSDMLGGMWARLRASMKRPSGRATNTPTMTAGIRGSEATESELKPYWKGDREQDPAYRAETQALKLAQDLADAQKFAEAAPAFEAFVSAHPASPLAPSALFGGALARAALGDRARAIASLEAFVRQNPQHPLQPDAQQALVALNGAKP